MKNVFARNKELSPIRLYSSLCYQIHSCDPRSAHANVGMSTHHNEQESTYSVRILIKQLQNCLLFTTGSLISVNIVLSQDPAKSWQSLCLLGFFF